MQTCNLCTLHVYESLLYVTQDSALVCLENELRHCVREQKTEERLGKEISGC